MEMPKPSPCPFCQDEYVHMSQVRVYPVQAISEVVVDNGGIHVSKSDAVKGQRGASIVIRFFCEGGHQWEKELKFHKGMTFEEIRKMPDVELATEKDIWRD